MRHSLSKGAAARGSKRHDGFPRKVVTFKEGVDDVRRGEPPERKPDKDGLIRCKVGKFPLDLRTAGRVVHLDVDAARLIVPVEVVLSIGDNGADLVEVCADDIGDLMGNRCRAPRR